MSLQKMKTIDEFSTEDLQRELTRRATVLSAPPAPLEQPDFTALREMVIKGMNEAAEREFQDDDFPHYVYEAALTAVYGPEFFAWRNRQRW